jgi:prevent-host-death family protein
MTIVTHLERVVMSVDVWTVAEAKAKLSEVIELARSDGPQTITRNGQKAVVVVSIEEWERKTRRTGNLATFFAASPLRESGLQVERPKDQSRPVEL